MDRLKNIQSKIYSWDGIKRQCAIWRFKDKKIVFTNGCFDILHLGHIEYLSRAADLGGVLIIGLNSDISVQKNKGYDRPADQRRRQGHDPCFPVLRYSGCPVR